jgi:hypothetical protein
MIAIFVLRFAIDPESEHENADLGWLAARQLTFVQRNPRDILARSAGHSSAARGTFQRAPRDISDPGAAIPAKNSDNSDRPFQVGPRQRRRRLCGPDG